MTNTPPDATLPIFPIGMVLFPGTAVPLHLFEPRYRALIADVQKGDQRFGILCAQSGVDERDLPPGRVGCVAEVTECEILPDGRANILVMGRERFALRQFVEHDALYHVAEVDWVPDGPAESPVALAVISDDVASNFKRVVKAVQVLNDDDGPLPDLPDNPAQLPWAIGAMIDIDLEARYRLLADSSPSARLNQIDGVLRKALSDVELRAAMHQKGN